MVHPAEPGSATTRPARAERWAITTQIAANIAAILGFLLAWGVLPPVTAGGSPPPVTPQPLTTSAQPTRTVRLPAPPGGVQVLVPRCVVVVVDANVPPGSRLWVGVHTGGPPARSYLLRLLELLPSQDGTWSAPGLTVGEKGKITKEFTLFAAVVPDALSRELESIRSEDRVYDDAWLEQRGVTKTHEILVQRVPDNGGC